MRTRLVCVVSALLGLLTTASTMRAQARPELVIGSGLLLLPLGEPGMQMFAAVKSNGPKRFGYRADVVLEQTRVRNLYVLGNVTYSPSQRSLRPYLIAGAGIYFDNGTPLAIGAGAGIEATTRFRVPVQLEARIISLEHQHLTLSVGVRP